MLKDNFYNNFNIKNIVSHKRHNNQKIKYLNTYIRKYDTICIIYFIMFIDLFKKIYDLDVYFDYISIKEKISKYNIIIELKKYNLLFDIKEIEEDIIFDEEIILSILGKNFNIIYIINNREKFISNLKLTKIKDNELKQKLIIYFDKLENCSNIVDLVIL